MTAIIPGRKISALGGAASAIEKQFEHIVKVFRAIESIHRWGTLNFWLDFPLRIINPDFTTELIEWSPGQLERFSLTEIRLQLVKNNSQVPAWIYVAHGSPHRGNALMIEVVCETVDIADNDRVFIHLPEYRYSSCLNL